MATAQIIEQGIRADEDDENKRSYVVTYRVKALAGATTIDQMQNALVVPGVPDIGDVFDTGEKAVCVSLSASPNNVANSMDVQATFEEPESGQTAGQISVEFSAGIETEQTKKDISGVPLRVQWDGKASDLVAGWEARFGVGKDPAITLDQEFTAEVANPQWRIVVQYRYHNLDDVKQDALTYVGKINALTWNTLLARTVLCTGISAQPDKPGSSTYIARLEFEYKPLTWDLDHRFEVEEYQFSGAFDYVKVKNVTPTNLNIPLGNGVGSFEFYEAVTFAPLGITF